MVVISDRATWTGPRPSDLNANSARLLRPVPPDRWPYGSPSFHETCCILRSGGLYCDCKASDCSDEEWGERC